MAFDGIHPQALIAPGAVIGEGVSVGPFAVVGEHVRLGDGVCIHPHAVLDGHTTLGAEVQVFPGAAVGLRPQDKKYDGSPTRLSIGARTVVRECATLQPGTTGTGCGSTEIGEDCLIMAYVHVAHDCRVGDGVIVANATQIAGHVQIDDHAILGGVTTVHQFCRIGTRAITGASSRVVQDVPPFMTADGHPARLFGLNNVGLKRAGFSTEAIRALKRAYRTIFLRGPFKSAIEAIDAELGTEHAEIAELCRFLRGSERGVTRARMTPRRDTD